MQIQKTAFLASLILSTSFGTSCKRDNPVETGSSTIQYIPIGDSYTAGHGADPDQAYPVLLTNDLNKDSIPIKLIVNEGIGGATTAEALADEIPVFDTSHATFASVLLGANDWVQDVDTATFRSNYVQIINSIQAKLPVKTKLLIITVPDLSATPVGRSQANGRNILQDINSINNIIKQEAGLYHLPVADIFPLSQEMHYDTSLIASDSLHPSAKEYARWEQMVILPTARKMLK
jgi:acyl-CoA thioesterase-1